MRTLRFLSFFAVFALALPLIAQDSTAPANGQITGTVTDVSGDALAGATVLLQGTGLSSPLKLESDDNGFFDFQHLAAGTYHLTMTAPGFSDCTSPDHTLDAGQYLIVSDCKLRISEVATTVNVGGTPEEIATEQVRIEETQRVFGVIPNFYVVYDPNPVPLTTKLKYHLALKTSTDIFTVVGVGTFAAINQAGDTPNYQQGFKGYGERFGAAAADGFSDIMIGGAILPSLLHQDPRYHFKGTGSSRSRIFHAISYPFVCVGDNGKRQLNLSSMGGDLASAGLSNLYYPPSDRGTGLVFQQFAINTGERMLSTLVQEFVLGKLTAKHGSRN